MNFRDRITCSVRDAQAASGWAHNKIYELINDGRLASVKIDGRRLIKVKSLLRLLGDDVPEDKSPRRKAPSEARV